MKDLGSVLDLPLRRNIDDQQNLTLVYNQINIVSSCILNQAKATQNQIKTSSPKAQIGQATIKRSLGLPLARSTPIRHSLTAKVSFHRTQTRDFSLKNLHLISVRHFDEQADSKISKISINANIGIVPPKTFYSLP